MIDFIHDHKSIYSVDAICKILPIASSTYYRQLDLIEHPEKCSKRIFHDQQYAEQIKRIWQESAGRYGVRKVWHQLKREGYSIARCTVSRLMQQLQIQGIWLGKNKRTTRSRDDQNRTDDLVKRDFSAKQPNPCEAVLLRSLISPIFKRIRAGSIRHLSLMYFHEQSLVGRCRHG